MDVIKKNLIIRFAYKTNEMKLSVHVVMKSWTHWFQFSALKCDHGMKWSDIMCMNISCPLGLRDIQQYEILPNSHLLLA
jgi:hypothetical protein